MPRLLPLLLAAVLASCGCEAGRAPASDDVHTRHPGAAETLPPPATDSTPAPDTTADGGLADHEAADVIRRYYAAIDAGAYRRAYSLWSDDGSASGQTFEAFAAGFEQTAQVEVEIGKPGRVEGAAGSLYVEIPVVVRARTKDGARQRFEGTYTLRRVNDVPGSTSEQRQWHIASAALRRVS